MCAPARWALLCAAAVLSACGGGAASSNSGTGEIVRFARPTGALQCGPSRLGPTERQLGQAALEAAGIRVQALACAQDGRPRITLCGTESGELLVADVVAERSGSTSSVQAVAELSARMTALGFQPWANWPDARTQACPSG